MGAVTLVGQCLETRLQALQGQHPRLYLADKGQDYFAALIEEDAELAKFAGHVVSTAEGLLDAPLLKRELEGRRLLDVSRECLRRILYWGVAYQLTGDARYPERAGDEMVNVAGFSDWNPSHFLDVGEMSAAMGIGYDWFYHELTEDARKVIRKGIIQSGLEASYLEDFWWVDGESNWNQVSHGGLVIGALAIYEDAPDISFKVIQRAIEHAGAGLKAYAPDGAYPEGPGYWSYGTSYSVLMLDALEGALGSDFGLSEALGFLESANYVLHAAAPSGDYFNYSDSGVEVGIRPELYWFARKLERPVLIKSQRTFLKAFNQGTLRNQPEIRMLPLLLIWGGMSADAGVSDALVWQGGGPQPVAFHRTSWTDSKASFVALKGGSPMVSHAHMDVGQFIMESDGVRWADDLGMQPYHELESIGLEIWGKDRWKVFRLNHLSHSVLVVDGKPQGLEGRATISEHRDGEAFSYTVVDMSEIYAGQLKSVQRGVALHPGGVVQIEDRLDTLDRATEVRWSMLTHADVVLDGPMQALLKQDGETLRVHVLSPKDAQLVVVDISEPEHPYDVPNPGAKMLRFTVRLDASAKDERLAVVLVPGSADASSEALPAMSEWSCQSR